MTKQPGPSPNAGSVENGLVEELQIVKSERDLAVGERKTLKQDVTELSREKQVRISVWIVLFESVPFGEILYFDVLHTVCVSTVEYIPLCVHV